ncbi:MAG: triose-phosphate isomerase [Metamycoplasmataceae bacterium]
MRKKIIIGNWKMNKDLNETKEFLEGFSKSMLNLKENLIFGIAFPSINIGIAKKMLSNNLVISSQDISKFESGAYTGEISAKMLKSYDVKYAVIGHSERRANHGETDRDVNQKAKISLMNKITPIICVGETLDEYENNKSKEVVKRQVLAAIDGIDVSSIVIAYEPIWAIGTGKTATIEYAQDICSFIRTLTNEKTLIQYGGSVSPSNINELLKQKDIDGALVGGASLELSSFLALINK